MEFRKLVGLAIIVISLVSLFSVIVVSYTDKGATIIELAIDNNIDEDRGLALLIGRTFTPMTKTNMEIYRAGIYNLVLTVDVKPVDREVLFFINKPVPHQPSTPPGTTTGVPVAYSYTPISATINSNITIEYCIIGIYSVANTVKPWSIPLYTMDFKRLTNYIKTTADDFYEVAIDGENCNANINLDEIDYDILGIVVLLKVDNTSKVTLIPRDPNIPPITVDGGATIQFLTGTVGAVIGKFPNGTTVEVSIASYFYEPLIQIKTQPELDPISVARAMSLALIGLIIYVGGPGRLVESLDRVTARRGRGGSG